MINRILEKLYTPLFYIEEKYTLARLTFYRSRLRKLYVKPKNNIHMFNTVEINNLREAIYPDYCGVIVSRNLSKVSGMEIAHQLAEEFKDNKKIEGILSITAEEKEKDNNDIIHSWLCSNLQYTPHTYYEPLSTIFPQNKGNDWKKWKKLVLILDKFDYFMNHPNRESAITHLAEDSVLGKNYVVLVLVHDENYKEEILNWNGQSKFRDGGDINNINVKE